MKDMTNLLKCEWENVGGKKHLIKADVNLYVLLWFIIGILIGRFFL